MEEVVFEQKLEVFLGLRGKARDNDNSVQVEQREQSYKCKNNTGCVEMEVI